MRVADRYRLEDVLGRGGMGEVWRAWDEALQRGVAVKFLLEPCPDEARDEARRFRREARIAARLNHPNLAAVYDFGTADDRPYTVMELVDGRSLAEELADGPLPPGRAARIGAQAAAGLAAAHRQGIVHRDVKPANLLLTSDDTLKIGDFGIACGTEESRTGLSAAGQMMGTSSYLAPERALGRPSGPPADVYALGCVLYQLLTGHPPFRADAAAAVLYQHVEATPAPVSGHRSDVPAEFEALIARMMAKDPGERPTADEACRALDALAGHSTGQLAGHPAVQREHARPGQGDALPGAAVREAPAPLEPTAPAPSAAPRRRRTQALAGALAAGAVVTAVAMSLPAAAPGTPEAHPALPRQTAAPGPARQQPRHPGTRLTPAAMVLPPSSAQADTADLSVQDAPARPHGQAAGRHAKNPGNSHRNAHAAGPHHR